MAQLEEWDWELGIWQLTDIATLLGQQWDLLSAL